MFGIIAAVLFGLALILDLADTGVGDLISAGTLTIAGLLFLALQLATPVSRTPWRGRRWGRR